MSDPIGEAIENVLKVVRKSQVLSTSLQYLNKTLTVEIQLSDEQFDVLRQGYDHAYKGEVDNG